MFYNEDENMIEQLANMEGAPQDQVAEMLKSKGTMTGLSMSVETLGMMAQYADLAVRAAFAELMAMAKELGTDNVPVFVLEELSKHQSTAAKMLWDAADWVGVDLTADVPDTIEGLD